MSTENVGSNQQGLVLYDQVEGSIDLRLLGRKGSLVEVAGDAFQFNPGDTVTLYVQGYAADGSKLEFVQVQTVRKLPVQLRFAIPGASLQPFAGRSATFYYSVDGVRTQASGSVATQYSATSESVEVAIVESGFSAMSFSDSGKLARAVSVFSTRSRSAIAQQAGPLSVAPAAVHQVRSLRAAGLAAYDPLFIPGLKPVQNADGGINYNMAHSSTSGQLIYIPSNAGIKGGDFIRIYWAVGGNPGNPPLPVASLPVTDEQAGLRIQLFVPARSITEGVCKVWYSVDDGFQIAHSEQLDILARFELPGGVDPDPSTPAVHEGLPLPVVPPDVIDKDAAQKGVVVSVPVYINQRLGDVIELSWGGHIVRGTVASATTSTRVDVPEAVILQAGDSDNLVVIYRIIDEVENTSAGWSRPSHAAVEASGDRLEAPILYDDEDEDGIIDLPSLGGEDCYIGVLTNRSDFAVGDTVTLYWDGKTAAGQAVPFQGQKPVIRVPAQIEFSIDNLVLLEIALGSAVCYYTVTGVRGTTPYFARSKRVSVSILGALPRMLMPSVFEAANNVLPPASPRARVIVPTQLTLLENDLVHLYWLGTKADGGAWLHEQQRTVSQELIGNDVIFTVDRIHIGLLNGGFVEVYYTIVHVGSSLALESDRLILNVGEGTSQLAAPEIVEVEEGVLDPDEITLGVDVIINVYFSMLDNDTLYLFWSSSSGIEYDDKLELHGEAVGQKVLFFIPLAVIEASLDDDVEVYFRVEHPGSPPRSSDPLRFRVGPAIASVPAPHVEHVLNDVLKLGLVDTVRGLAVTVPVEATLLSGDLLYLDWLGEVQGGSYTPSHYITGQEANRAYTFYVPYANVAANRDRNVAVSYRIDRRDGSQAESLVVRFAVERAPIPVPIIFEAKGNTINPDDVDAVLGAGFIIGADAELQVRDEITAYWNGKTEVRVSKTIVQGEQGRELRLPIPRSVVVNDINEAISIRYTIARTGVPLEESGVNDYEVRRVPGTGRLKIMGARYNQTIYRYSGASQVISALDISTHLPLQAEWKYADQNQWTTSSTWLDVSPEQALQVRFEGDLKTLNPANIYGNGADTTVNGTSAFVAKRNDGQLVAWGNPVYGGAAGLINIANVHLACASGGAYVALRENGQIVTWGVAAAGGTLPASVPSSGFKHVAAAGQALAGIRDNGTRLQVVAWGAGTLGGTVPAAIAALPDVVSLYGGGSAFAGLRSTRELVAWGANGGTLPANIGAYTDVIDVMGNYTAFCALRDLGNGSRSVVAWGAGAAATVPTAIGNLTTIGRLASGNAQAFAVLLRDGSVEAWGTANYGGTIPAATKPQLVNVIDICSTWQSFCARLGNGSVIAWGGDATTGGVVPAAIGLLRDIVQVIGTSKAFAALRATGEVVAWGTANLGGNTDAVAGLLVNVVALYANSHGFTALTSDNRVVTWGFPQGGGDSAAQQPLLQNAVTYEASQQSLGSTLSAVRNTHLERETSL